MAGVVFERRTRCPLDARDLEGSRVLAMVRDPISDRLLAIRTCP